MPEKRQPKKPVMEKRKREKQVSVNSKADKKSEKSVLARRLKTLHSPAH